MTDYRPIESHIRRARLQHSAWLGEQIAEVIAATWFGAERLANQAARKVHMLVRTPDSYSTSMPHRF